MGSLGSLVAHYCCSGQREPSLVDCDEIQERVFLLELQRLWLVHLGVEAGETFGVFYNDASVGGFSGDLFFSTVV